MARSRAGTCWKAAVGVLYTYKAGAIMSRATGVLAARKLVCDMALSSACPATSPNMGPRCSWYITCMPA